MNNQNFDAIIVGGSYAGLSAALALGRSLRNVLVIDSGQPCNRYTPHSHNFLTRDGETPGNIASKAKKDASQYKTVNFYEGTATKATKTNTGFIIETASGEEFGARKLVLATGLKDILPDIEGFEECWGKSVIHCPYCHGYEYTRQTTGIIANGDAGYHYAELISNWTKDLTIFSNGPHSFTDEQLAKIKKNNIKVIEYEIEAIHQKGGQVQYVLTKNGSSFPVNAIYSKPKNVQHSGIAESLGCELTDQGLLKVDETRMTTIAGVFACGDNSTFRSVATAVYSGSIAGAMVNKYLIDEDF
jgi:thioredoxin reductase